MGGSQAHGSRQFPRAVAIGGAGYDETMFRRAAMMFGVWVFAFIVLAALILWPVSYHRCYGLMLRMAGHRFTVGFPVGSVFFNLNSEGHLLIMGPFRTFNFYSQPAVAIPTTGDTGSHWLGFHWFGTMMTGQRLAVPAWFVVLLSGSAAGILWWKLPPVHRASHCCQACGYDLRGSPADGACPECGATRPSPAPSSSGAGEPQARRDSCGSGMRRWVFTILAWVCLVPAAAVLVLWPISQRMTPYVVVGIGSMRFFLGAVGGSVCAGARSVHNIAAPPFGDGLGRFAIRWFVESYEDPQIHGARLGFFCRVAPTGSGIVGAPAWFLIAILVSAAVILERKVQAGTQLMHLCPTCGYDLRGSPPDGSCPECGAARPSPVPSSSGVGEPQAPRES